VARTARPGPGTSLGAAWRRVTAWLRRSLWLQASGALLVAYLVILPLSTLAIGQEHRAAADSARVRSESDLQDDLQQLRMELSAEAAAAGAYAVTGDRAFQVDSAAARGRAASAWASVTAEARVSGFVGDLPPVARARGALEAWAAEQAPAGGDTATRPALEAAALEEGQRQQAAFDAAMGGLDARAGAGASRDGAQADALNSLALRGDIFGPLLGNGMMVVLAGILIVATLRPVSRLAGVAAAHAHGARPAVPYTARRSEVGSLARALVRWQQSDLGRLAVFEHSPVGMFTVRPDLQVVDVNPALRAMLGVRTDDQEAVRFGAYVDPDDVEATYELVRVLAAGTRDAMSLEARFVRSDGSAFWGNLTVAVVRRPDAQPSLYVGLIEDISERHERLRRAAAVQRDLLPDAAPELEGYQLAGLCRPGREIGGDFFDWDRQGSALTLTLGDVMGTGMPAALLMAIVRIALRTSAALPTVQEAVRSVAASTERELSRSGAFMKVFHGRLDLATGTLDYVDAGLGLVFVVDERGASRPAGRRALPLGIMEGERYEASSLTLEAGESLVVFSDGLLQTHPQMEGRLERVGELLQGARDAQEMVHRLTSGGGTKADDVTAVVLRRLAGAAGS
jgi:PAS domain S-box-containing protein